MNNNEFNNNNGSSYSSLPDKNTGEPIVIREAQNGEYHSAPNKAQRPRKKRSHSIPMVIISAVLCVLLAGGAGFGGALIANRMSSDDGGSDSPVVTTAPAESQTSVGEGGVIYKSVNTDGSGTSTAAGSIADVAANAADSVVEITTETIETSTYFGQYVTSGAGSGVIITENGYIITCDHVVNGASTVTVTLTNGDSYDATIVGEDSVTDIAVLKIDANNLTCAVIGDSDSLVVGQDAIAIGNPLGELGGTVTNGIISALDRQVEVDGQTYNLLQTNAAINPGNSGGGLFNINSELIGIVNAKSSGSGIEGLGFAIPINDAIAVAEQLIDYGYIKGRPMLGVYVYEVTDSTDYWTLRSSDYATLINYITETGVYFIKYNTDSGQTEGDLQFGDRIVALDGVTVSTQSDIAALLNDEYAVGDKITLTVARITDSKTMRTEMVSVDITLIENVPASK